MRTKPVQDNFTAAQQADINNRVERLYYPDIRAKYDDFCKGKQIQELAPGQVPDAEFANIIAGMAHPEASYAVHDYVLSVLTSQAEKRTCEDYLKAVQSGDETEQERLLTEQDPDGIISAMVIAACEGGDNDE